ncbi:cation transporter [Vibrio makurazakiensis]|uniref:cation transporter n=1 Tax=Vibrio makurazakiensis TaxID=2910250 RepID=UPI003D0CAD35
MREQIAHIERRALIIGIIANLVMAISGWAAFNLSGSEALLLDGNMSFILFITTLVALKITKIKSKKSDTFPFGLYVAEALYSLMKGLLLLGVVVSAISSNGSKVLSYWQGAAIEPIKTGIIIYYAIAMVIICWGLSLFYYSQNKRINNNSSMLKVDQKSSFIDGILSASTGAILVVIGFIEPTSQFSPLLYIGDSILVITLALMMITQPINIMKEAFVELAGGKLQDNESYQDIKSRVESQLFASKHHITTLHISKTGSSYLVVIGLDLATLKPESQNTLINEKKQLQEKLECSYPFIDVEMTLT